MRVRTLLAFGFGAAVGAGITFLGDPDHGDERRGAARRWAIAQGRQQATVAASAALQAFRTSALAAAEGFRESLSEPSDVG